MFAAILILLLLPITDVSRSRGMQFRPLSKVAFYVFVANFLILMQLGAKHVESPFIEFGQLSTVLYFLYFSVAMYGITLIENSITYLSISSSILSHHTSESYKPHTFNSLQLQSSMLNISIKNVISVFSSNHIECDAPQALEPLYKGNFFNYNSIITDSISIVASYISEMSANGFIFMMGIIVPILAIVYLSSNNSKNI